jgi:predicted acetyltransferase
MQIAIIPAGREQEPVLANLLQLYAHDFSKFHKVELGARFVYKQLSLYWSDPQRHPFLIWIAGTLAGFVLVKRGSEVSDDATVWDMAEFFVLREWRGHGVGTHVAQEVWRRFPGRWQVRVMEANVAALQFWERAISRFLGRASNPVRLERDGSQWWVFSFESEDVSQRS